MLLSLVALPDFSFAYIGFVSAETTRESEKKPIGLLCNSSSWGGLEMNVLSLAQWMSQRGWPVVIYGRSDSILARESRALGIRFTHISSSFKFGDIRNARRLARALASDGVEVLINNINQDIFLAVLAKRFSKTPLKLFYYQHMQLGIDKRDAFHSWLYGNLDAWIAPLPGFIDSLKSRTKLDISRAHVIPFGIDIAKFGDSLPSRLQARKSLELPEDANIVGVVGRLDPKKGQHTLIEALAHIKDEQTKLHVLIIGDKTHGEAENYEKRLHKLCSELGLNDRVHFRPHRADVEMAYAALDIFVLTSESETYGMVTLEALASGIPTIGTNSGGTRELIENGVDGLLYDYEDSAGLSKCIGLLLEDQSFARALSEKAILKVESSYSYQRQCQELEKLIESFR